MDPEKFGIFCGCIEHGQNPRVFPSIQERAKSAFMGNGVIGRRLLKRAGSIMAWAGLEKSAAAQHMRLVSDFETWDEHAQDVADTVVGTLMADASFSKHAIADVLEAAHTGMKGLGYAAMGGGAGLGALYWLLAQHANQDEAEVEALRDQTKYYQGLGRSIQDTMQRKYDYNGRRPQKQTRPA